MTVVLHYSINSWKELELHEISTSLLIRSHMSSYEPDVMWM